MIHKALWEYAEELTRWRLWRGMPDRATVVYVPDACWHPNVVRTYNELVLKIQKAQKAGKRELRIRGFKRVIKLGGRSLMP